MEDNFFEHKEGFCYVNQEAISFTKSQSSTDLVKGSSVFWIYFYYFADALVFLVALLYGIIQWANGSFIYAIIAGIVGIASAYKFFVTRATHHPNQISVKDISAIKYGITKFGAKRAYFELEYIYKKHKLKTNIIMPLFTENGGKQVEVAKALFKKYLPAQACLF